MKKIKVLITFVFMMCLIALPSSVQAKEKINVYLFRGEGCPHCEEALKFFDGMDEEYKKYYNLVKYEVWYDQTNSDLMQKVANYLKEETSGVPYIVIGKKTFSGYAETYDDEIKSTIKKAYESEDYVDVVKTVKSEKETIPIIPIVIVVSIAVVIIGGLVVITKKL